MPVKQGMASLEDGYRVRYLGSLGFSNGSRKPGIQTLQRPMLELYSKSRRRGEDRRSSHPLTLVQFLDVSTYGLVVVDLEEDPEDGELSPIITKVITPIENVIMWAAVRFHASSTKKKSMGAAFVPIACSDGVLDKNSFIQLGAKQRFLVSLTHPPLFVCMLQRVDSPKSIECHAFVCASAEDSLSLCSIVNGSKEERLLSGGVLGFYKNQERSSVSQTYRSNSEEDLLSTITPSSMTTLTEATTSQFTVDSSRVSRLQDSRRHKNRSISCPRATDESSIDYAEFRRENPSPVLGRRYTNVIGDKTPKLSQRFVHSRYQTEEFRGHQTQKQRSKSAHRKRSVSPSDSRNTSDYDKVHHQHRRPLPVPNVNKNKDDISNQSLKKEMTKPTSIDHLPRYQFGQTEKSFQTNGQSVESSDESYSPTPIQREMVTVSHTVEFSSEEGESEPVYSYSTRSDPEIPGKRTSYRREMSGKYIGKIKTLSATDSLMKEAGTMTDKRVTRRDTSSEVEDSDASRVHYTKSRHQAEIRNTYSRRRRSSLGKSNQTDFSSESELNVVLQHPKYLKHNADKGVWVHPAVFKKKECSRTNQQPSYGYQEEYDMKSNAQEEILGNGTSRVTINVPYKKDQSSQVSDSSYSKRKPVFHPQGVRSFHRSDQVRNWSTVSVTSDQSYQSSATLPIARIPKHQNAKVIRWSSVERLPRRKSLFTTIKRFSVRSLTRARKKTEQLLNSLKSRIKSDKASETTSGDSAYDTSEVCLRPDGDRQQNALKKKKRRQSWSFHDLRTEFPLGYKMEKRTHHRSNDLLNKNRENQVGSGTSGTSTKELVIRKKKRKHYYRGGVSYESSDSGVEEYVPSDYSEAMAAHRRRQLLNRRAESDPELMVSQSSNRDRVKGRRSYSRWSQTDLHEQLGYIP